LKRVVENPLLLGMSLALGVMVCLSLEAQTRPKDGECLPDEIDLGEYCASLPPPQNEEERKKRTVTRFRGKSMMPGIVSDNNEKPAKTVAKPPVQKEIPAAEIPVTLTQGFMIQLGAFSKQESAELIASSIENPEAPVNVNPLQSGERQLWACTLGPFADKSSAEQARDRLRTDKRFRTAFVTAWKSDPQ
jgi:cell division septation protein DedD